jgi:hypothetical protein
VLCGPYQPHSRTTTTRTPPQSQLKTALQNGDVVFVPPVKEASKLLATLVKNVAESAREFVRWMDGTCLEMADQCAKGDTDGEPLLMHFSTEVIRMQQVGSAGGVRVMCKTAAGPHVSGPDTIREPSSLPPGCLNPPFLPRSPHQVMGAAVQVHQDISKAASRLRRHIDGWKKYADIWKADRVTLLDKFKAKGPPTAAFEEKFAKFQKVRGCL